MKRFCLALDLYDDDALIAQYEQWHEHVWPEVLESIRDAGILDMKIYRVSTRMFMVMETEDSFSFEAKAAADASNQRVQEWETLMWQFQKGLPFAKNGEKWMLMNEIFSLK
jgi:L-rhamnose mutarotase